MTVDDLYSTKTMTSNSEQPLQLLVFLFVTLLTLSMCGDVSSGILQPNFQPTARTAADGLWKELKDLTSILLAKLSFSELILNSHIIFDLSQSVSSLSVLDYSSPENNCAVCEVSQMFLSAYLYCIQVIK